MTNPTHAPRDLHDLINVADYYCDHAMEALASGDLTRAKELHHFAVLATREANEEMARCRATHLSRLSAIAARLLGKGKMGKDAQVR